jgi:LEA14-like dessication related protein
MNGFRFSFVSLLLIGFLLSGCFTNPEFKGFDNFKLNKFQQNVIDFSIDVKLFNPNGYGIKVRPSNFDVFINGDFVGKAKLQKAFKMKRKSESNCLVPVSLKLEKGMIMRLLALANLKSGVDIRLKGFVKASVMGIPKKEKIDQSKHVNLRNLNLNFGSLF